MKIIIIKQVCLILLSFLLCPFVHPQTTSENASRSMQTTPCGKAVLDYLQSNHFTVQPGNTCYLPADGSLQEMLLACRSLKKDAQAVNISDRGFDKLPFPGVLHLKTNHYIALLKHDANGFSIYDPAAPHIKRVGENYLREFASGTAIVFSDDHNLKELSAPYLQNISGSYQHEYPPPNQTDDGYRRGRRGSNRPQGECRNKRGGSPLISFNPVILNIVVEDIPMWYDAGVGPAIVFDMVYNSNDEQEISGTLGGPTQYYPLGKRWSFSYATFYKTLSGDEILVIMPDGSRETFTFSGDNSTPSHADNYNELTRYAVVGGYGYSLTMKDSKLVYRYDSPVHSKLTSIEDPNGNVVELEYDLNYNLKSVSDANGRSVEFTLDGSGRITQAEDPFGRTVDLTYGYTDNEFLVSITDMAGYTSEIVYDQVQIVQQFGFTVQPQIVSITTPAGTSEIEYTATGNIGPGLLAFYWTFTNPNGVSSSTYFSYGTANTGIIKMYDNNGNFDEYYVDLPSYRITHITKPDPAASVFYGYDANGNTTSISTGSFEEQFIYDESGDIVEFIDPRGQSTLFTYDDNHNVTEITDPMGRVQTFEYDDNQNLTAIITAVSAQYFTYYADGNMESYTDGNGNTIEYSYDAFGYLSEISYPIGNPTTIINDELGRITSLTDYGLTTTYEYDDLDQITKVSYPDGTSDEYVYDFQNVAEQVDRGNRKVNYSWDGMNQIIEVSGPQGFLKLDRDGNGNIISLSINGQSTWFEFDEMDRMTSMINEDGTSRHYTYNEIGNVLTRRDENGILTTYSYDYDMLTLIDYSDGTPDVSFEHNLNGELTQITDATGTSTYSYDDGGRLIAYSGPGQGDDFTYTLDSVNNRKSLSIEGLEVEYQYDALNRLTQVQSNYSSAVYEYDDNSNLIQTLFGNDTYSEYAYDDQNRLSALSHKKSSGDMIRGYQYLLDENTLLRKITEHDGFQSAFSYDNAYQLTEEQVMNPEGKTLWHHIFNYDNMGNLIEEVKNDVSDTYTYNNLNQLTSAVQTCIDVSGVVQGDSSSIVYVEGIEAVTSPIGANQISFLAENVPLYHEGDTVKLYARVNDVLATVDDSSKFICTANAFPDESINILLYRDIENVAPENVNTIYIKKNPVIYDYDNNGNLAAIRTPYDTTGFIYDAEDRLKRIDLPCGMNREFVYDAFGQLTHVIQNGILKWKYVYDNFFEPVVVFDSANQKKYITRGLGYAGGVGGIAGIYDATNGNVTGYFNHRGDLIAATNTDEVIISEMRYHGFGDLYQASGNYSPHFRFSTKFPDAESGLYYFGARFYSPEQKRWLNRDPFGFAGGLNLYAFAGNNPVMMIDPYGYDIPPDIASGLETLNNALNSAGGTITRETVVNTIENLARTGKIAPNFLSRVGGMARAGSAITGVLQTFLSPEGAEAMKGAIQLARALKKENEMVRKHNLLGCGKRLRPGQKRLSDAAKKFKKSLIGKLLYW